MKNTVKRARKRRETAFDRDGLTDPEFAVEYAVSKPHRAVLMVGPPIWHSFGDGCPWCERYGTVTTWCERYGTVTTAMCLKTHQIGTAGADECFVLGRLDSERSRMDLALHILSVNCGGARHLYE